MSINEYHGVRICPDGIYLHYSFHESASGHEESTTYKKLSVLNDEEILLEIYHDNLGFLKGMHSDISSIKYKIDANMLSKLIQEHGVKIEK